MRATTPAVRLAERIEVNHADEYRAFSRSRIRSSWSGTTSSFASITESLWVMSMSNDWLVGFISVITTTRQPKLFQPSCRLVLLLHKSQQKFVGLP